MTRVLGMAQGTRLRLRPREVPSKRAVLTEARKLHRKLAEKERVLSESERRRRVEQAEHARDTQALSAALDQARKPWLKRVRERAGQLAKKLFRRDN